MPDFKYQQNLGGFLNNNGMFIDCAMKEGGSDNKVRMKVSQEEMKQIWLVGNYSFDDSIGKIFESALKME